MTPHNFEAVFAIGTTEENNRAAVLIKADSGPLETIVRHIGATETADNLGLFDREDKGAFRPLKWKNGTYRVNAYVNSDAEFDDIYIQEI